MFHTQTPFGRRTPRTFSGILTPATLNPFQTPSVPSLSPDRLPNERLDSWAGEDQAATKPIPRPNQVRDIKFWVAVGIVEISVISFGVSNAILFGELGQTASDGNGRRLSAAVGAVVSFAICLVSQVVCCVLHGRMRHREGKRSSGAESIALKRLNGEVHRQADGVERGRNSEDENRQRSENMQRQLNHLEDELQRRNHQTVVTGLRVPDESDLGIYSLNKLGPASVRSYPHSMQSNDSATAVRSSFNSSMDGGTAVINYSPLDDILSSERIRNMSHRDSRAYFEMRRERQALPNGVHVAGQGTVRAVPSARRVIDPARFELRDDFEVNDDQTHGHWERNPACGGEAQGRSIL